jgi:thiol-disulfide isomerase/thioredoxin
MAPIVHGLEEKYGDQVKFVYLDIDDPKNTSIRRELGVGWPPVFYLLDIDGTILDRRYLYKETEELEEIFQKVLEDTN